MTRRDAHTGDPRQRLAIRGENEAARVLERAGLDVLERRFRCRMGEIDLIARDGETVVFVEVKTRSGTSFGRPSEAVTPRKRRRIARVAQLWLSRCGGPEPPCRFDVVEVMACGRGLRVHHVRDAFRLTPTG